MFTHRRPIGATAIKMNVLWSRKEPGAFGEKEVFERLRELPGQQLAQRVEAACTGLADCGPIAIAQGVDCDNDIVRLWTASLHHGGDVSGGQLQIQHTPMPDVTASASNAIAVVGIPFQVMIPGLPPPGP